MICSEKVYGREKTELIKGGLATLKNRLDFVQLPVQNERKRRKCSIQGDASRGTAPNRYLYDCPYLISGDSLRSTAKEGHIAGQFPASLNPSTGTSESASIQPPSAIWDFTGFAVSESQVAIASHEATWTFSHVRPALNSGRLITRDARSFNDDSRLTNNVGRIDEFFPSNETFDEDGHLDPI